MIRLDSPKSHDELIKDFDERTSEARFAGNDAVLDNIFVTRRRGDRFTLVRKAKSLRDPFAAVFHGRIISNSDGTSSISGFFARSAVDYIAVILFFAFLMVIRSEVISRGEPVLTVNIIIVMYLLLAASFLMTFKSTKQRYIEFLKDITDRI